MTKTKRQPGRPPRNRQERPARPRSRPRIALVFLGLAIATLAVFGVVWSYSFVSYEDPEHVTANPTVLAGVTSDGAAWALTTFRIGRWFPLTWLSHMIDCQLFGLHSGMHHLMNVLLHLCNAMLLFVLLRRMTGAFLRSALVAFLFALHPLHVEPVAWVAQRSAVLSALFWFLTLWIYLRYVERPTAGRYLSILLPFCLGLLSGPTILAMPVVLVLLDVWPLRRMRMPAWVAPGRLTPPLHSAGELHSLSFLLVEKAMMFELSAGAAVATAVLQNPAVSLLPREWAPLGSRLALALISWIQYLAQTIWPAKLAVSYPHPAAPPVWQVIGVALALAGISLLALRVIRRAPYLAVGWFWYLAALAPALGLVLGGGEPRADRYTYMPLVGIFLALTWGAADAFARRPNWKPAPAILAAAACLACMMLSWNQVRQWRDSETLYRHAIDVTGGSYVGYYGLAGVLSDRMNLKDAALLYVDAIQSAPGDARAYGELADVLVKQGKTDEAATLYREALRLNPNSERDRISLGITLSRAGKTADSIELLEEAIRMNPKSAEAHDNLGQAYMSAGETGKAEAQFDEVIRLQPENADAHYNLGTALAHRGKMIEAVAEFEAAIRWKPGYASAHNNLGSALASLGRVEDAVVHLSEALRLAPDSEEVQRNLQYARSLLGKSGKKQD